jgi:3-dehydroquinate synthase
VTGAGEERTVLERRPAGAWGAIYAQRFSVAYDYPVIFTRNAFDPANPIFVDAVCGLGPTGKCHSLAIFVDTGVLAAMPGLEHALRRYESAHRESLRIAGDVVAVQGGEVCKNDPQIVHRLVGALAERAIDRHSYVVAIGGGAVLDVVGYAAAIFHRGVRHIRFPTTVLSQDDSGVGVKNAINCLGLKNLLGTFAPPAAVINDGAFIDCLPARGKRSGMAEAVKVALIRDASFFTWIEHNAEPLAAFDPGMIDVLVERSALLHMRQIATGGDPFESGSSRPLDFGHWSAHKLEMLTQHALDHGEAVGIGIALDAHLSVSMGHLAPGGAERICRLLEALGFELWHPALHAREEDGRPMVLRGLRDFQEHLGGDLTVTLLAGIGRGIDVHAIDAGLVERAITWLGERRHGRKASHAA